jgi:hypothetical protein
MKRDLAEGIIMFTISVASIVRLARKTCGSADLMSFKATLEKILP